MSNLVMVDGSTLAPTLQSFHQGIQSASALHGALQSKKAAEANQAARKEEIELAKKDQLLKQQQAEQKNQMELQKQQQQQNNQQLAANILAPRAPGAAGVTPAPQAQLIQQQQMAELFAKDPELASKVQAQFKFQNEQHAQQAYGSINTALNTPYEQRQSMIMQLPLQEEARKQLLQMDDVSQQNALRAGAHSFLSAEKQAELSKPSSLEQNLITQGYTPGTPEFQQAARDQSKKVPLVDMRGEQAESKGVAGVRVKGYEAVQLAAETAEKVLDDVRTLQSLDPKTNLTAPVRSKIAAVADSFGLKGIATSVMDASNSQSVEAVTNNLVNGILNSAKGPQTDADAARARKSIGNLGDTKEAFVFKNNYIENVSKRQIEQRDFIDQRLGNGDDLATANKSWRDYKQSTPLISNQLKQNGMPVFYYQFKDQAKQNNPEASDEQILSDWRAINGVKANG